jgi:myo-inositol-1(or 4)-monophosphatase
MNINLELICKDAIAVSKRAGEFIMQEWKNFTIENIEIKGHNNLVSYVDKNAEAIIVDGLKKILPEAGFITEENTDSIRKEVYNWIIDPLDGTTNYIHGLPCFCISIALIRHDKIVVGVVHELNFNECFYAWENGGAFLNGESIKVSQVKKVADSLLATGFPYHNYTRMKPYMEVFDYCLRNTHGLRRLGSAAADLAYVACGRFEGFYEYGLNPWDVGGGAIIVKEAGGSVTDFKGENNFLFGEEIIATNGKIAKEFTDVIKAKFKL